MALQTTSDQRYNVNLVVFMLTLHL